MKVVILVAGVGSRLWPLTRNTPKSLVDLGNGLTLLETQLEAIKPTGVKEIILVTGYRSKQIEAKIEYYKDFNFTIVYNPFYDISNNLVSAWMAIPYLKDEFILINGDDIYRKEVFNNLLHFDSEISMVVSQKDHYDDDDMKVFVRDDHVIKVSKELDKNESNGESIGMLKFTGRGRGWFANVLNEMVREKDNLNLYYLHAIQKLIDQGSIINPLYCSDDDWAEIDFHPDLRTIQSNLTSKVDLVDIIKTTG